MSKLTESALNVGYSLLDKVHSQHCCLPLVACSQITQGVIPDVILRVVIRALCRQRLREINMGSMEANHTAKMKWIEQVRARSTIADYTDKANEQHYEVCANHLNSWTDFSCPSFPGADTIHSLVSRAICKVLVLSVPYWEGNIG